MADWWVYLLRCGDGSLYTGIARDVERRLAEHRSGKGARYTRSHLPVELVYRERQPDKSAALRREAAIKALTRAEKLRLIAAGTGEHHMRRKDRQTTEETAWSIVDSSDYAVLAMTAPDGTPYCLPLNIVRRGSSVYFHSAQEGKKLDCLRQNPAVCLSCIGKADLAPQELTTKYASAIAFGTASEVTDEEEKADALRLLCRRFAPGQDERVERAIVSSGPQTAIFRLDITEITGKSNC